MGPKILCELLVSVPRCSHVQRVLRLSSGARPTTHFLGSVPRSDTSRSSAHSISPRASVPLNAHYYSSHSVFATVFTPCFCAASLLALIQASKVVVRRLALSTYSTAQYCNPDSNSCLSPAVILDRLQALQT